MLEIMQIKLMSTAGSGQAGRERLHLKCPLWMGHSEDPVREQPTEAPAEPPLPPASAVGGGRAVTARPQPRPTRPAPCSPAPAVPSLSALLSPKHLAAAKPDGGSVHCPKHHSSELVN